MNHAKYIDDQTEENEIYIENWIYAKEQKQDYKVQKDFNTMKMKPVNKSLVHLQKQSIKFGIDQYRQIGYNEWVDYFSKPFAIRSEKNSILSSKNSKVEDEYITPKMELKYHKNVSSQSPLKADEIEDNKSNTQSDLSISFEYDKNKSKKSIFRNIMNWDYDNNNDQIDIQNYKVEEHKGRIHLTNLFRRNKGKSNTNAYSTVSFSKSKYRRIIDEDNEHPNGSNPRMPFTNR